MGVAAGAGNGPRVVLLEQEGAAKSLHNGHELDDEAIHILWRFMMRIMMAVCAISEELLYDKGESCIRRPRSFISKAVQAVKLSKSLASAIRFQKADAKVAFRPL